MMMWGYGWGWLMPLWMGLGILFWVGVVALVVWAVTRLANSRPPTAATFPPQSGLSATQILDQRYARGELDDATYQQMRERLQGPEQPRE